MLTNIDYTSLWGSFAAIPSLMRINPLGMPLYQEYLEREHFQQDYLDIFRGYNSRGNFRIRPIHPIVMLPPHPFFDLAGNPLLNINGVNLQNVYGNSIKHILIAEACPIGGANYIYDVSEIDPKGQTYLRACFSATYGHNAPFFPWKPITSVNDKITVLLDLARRGVLLLDIFPFALKYDSTPRGILNTTGVTHSFWNDLTNTNNLQSRIIALCPFLDIAWDLSLMAPCTISEYIVGTLSSLVIKCKSGKHHAEFKKISKHPKRRSDFKKIVIDTSFVNPNSELISLSF